MRRAWLTVIVAGAFACGSSYSAADSIPPPPTGPDASDLDASAPSVSTPDAEVPVIPPVSVDGPCDAAETPIDQGIFVSHARGKDDNAGSAVSPVATLGRALLLAKGSGHREIYVAAGTYEEPAALLVQTSDLRISGAWKEDPLRWTRDCSPGRRAKTVVYVAGSPALGDAFPASTAGKIFVEGLSVATVSKTSTAASSYVLFLKGSGPDWELSDVTLVADRGRDGVPGANAPTTPGACAPCGSGVSGKPGSAGAAVAPSFTSEGFVLGDGTRGASGTAGEPGKPPGPAPTVQGFAGGCSDKTEPNCGSKTPLELVTGKAGTCGCGGAGGAGGGGGGGGGGSIAIFASGTRRVHAVYTHMKSVGGGDGRKGTAGGAGVAGTAGAAGASIQYDARRCQGQAGGGSNQKCVADSAPNQTLAGGPAGGPGGMGGAGGAGGPGAGGAAYGIVTLGATVDIGEAIVFEVGPGGQAAPGAAPGPKGERLDL